MRASSVRRFAVALFLATLIAAFAFERLSRPPASPDTASDPVDAGDDARGGELFARHCGSCHAADELQQAIARMPAARAAALAEFLESHGEASAVEDNAILEFLKGRRKKEEGRRKKGE